MGIARDDRWVQDALGRNLAGAQIYWCTQPATVTSLPPSPLATIYSDIAGADPITQPVTTDGFGHADAYMDNSVLYTVVVVHPLFGPNPDYNNQPVVVLPDQSIGGGGGGGGGGSTVTPFAGTPIGTIDGTNKTFVLANNGTPLTAIPTQFAFLFNGQTLIPGLGFTGPIIVSGSVQITMATAPQPASGGGAADALYAYGITIS